MKSITWAVGALVAVAMPVFAQDAGPWSGPWETNQGRMHIETDGDRARGEYDLNEGRVRGEADGGSFHGLWAQSMARHRCYEERMDTHYWGHFTLNLSSDGRYFNGRWWYCDEEPGSGGEWHGHRPHHYR